MLIFNDKNDHSTNFRVILLSKYLLLNSFVHVSVKEVTVEMLTELDRLVQLLESPIFTFMRMEVKI